FVGDNFVYLHGTVADTDLPWAVMGAVAFSEHELMDGVSLDRWLATDWDSASLRAAAIAPPRLVLDGVTHNEATSGLWGALGFSASLVDVVLRGSTLEFGNGVVALVSVGDITIESSSVTSGTLTVATPTGTVHVAASAIESTGPTVFGAERGLQVIDSAVLITDGSLQVIGNAATAMTGSTQPTGGPIEFKGSTVEVLDSDLLDASNHGSVTMLTQFAPISLIDNVLLRSHDDFTILTLDSQHGEADIELRGNIDVRVGVFVTESAAGARAADLTVQTMGSGLRNRL